MILKNNDEITLLRSLIDRFILSLFFFLLFFHTACAQLIDMSIHEPQTLDMKFNATLVSTSRIKSILVKISEKPDLQMIVDRGETQGYEFDSTGKVIRFFATRVISKEQVETVHKAVYKKGRRISPAYTEVNWKYVFDTNFTWFMYDRSARLIMKRSNYGDFYNTFYYDYDSLGKLSKETNCKETNKNPDKHHFELGVQTILSQESFEYVMQSPTQIKKRCLNDDGKVYKQGIINRDSNSVEEDFSFVVGYVRYTNRYTYDNSGKLIEKMNYTNSNGDMKVTRTFQYDENGNITEERININDVNTGMMAYIYDPEQRLLKSRLERDFGKANIEILKFIYEFYP